MKRFLLSLTGLLLVAAAAMAKVGDRIDAYRADGTSVSFIADDIEEITYTKASPDADGFAFVNILLVSGEMVTLDMKEFPELRYVHYAGEYLEIQRMPDPHTELILLDCRNNEGIMDPSKPEDWRAEQPGGVPHFYLRSAPGYESRVRVVGAYTGKVYTDSEDFIFVSSKDDNLLGVNTLAFVMPGEPVQLITESEELTTYQGAPFLGTYKGYAYDAAGLLVRSGTPTFTAELKANGSYHMTSADANAYDFADLYSYTPSTGRFSYVPDTFDEDTDLGYYIKKKLGARGLFGTDGMAFIDIIDLIEDKPENTRRYIVGKDDFDIICAFRDRAHTQALLEISPAGKERRWILATNSGNEYRDAGVDFLEGSSIGEPCEALVACGGETLLKYVLREGADPQFIAIGVEAGTYEPAGEGGTLVLDGFGNATLNGLAATYTIEGMVVTLAVDGGERTIIINAASHTYADVVAAEWDGPATYANENVTGAFEGGAPNTANSISITIDHNLKGDAKPGYAAVAISIARGDGRSIQAVTDCQPYVYQPGTRTLTITNLLVGLPQGGSARRNLVFRLSDDKKLLYIDSGEPRIYAVSYPGSYVQADMANALTAVSAPAPELATEYEAAYKGSYMGTPFDATGTLLIGADTDGTPREGYATFVVKAMGANLISACVPYEADGARLTLKGVTVGDGNYGTRQADLTFTIDSAGNLTGSTTVYGTDFTTALMAIDLASAQLCPKAAQLPEGWVRSYAGQYFTELDGEVSGVANVEATLRIDQDADGKSKPGHATFVARSQAITFASACVEYELTAGAVTLKGIDVKTDGGSAPLTFALQADGTLQATGRIYGSYTFSAFCIDLGRAALSPAE